MDNQFFSEFFLHSTNLIKKWYETKNPKLLETAIVNLQKLLNFYPRNEELILQLAEALLNSGQYGLVVNLCDAVLDRTAKAKFIALYYKGMAYRRVDMLDDARSSWLAALKAEIPSKMHEAEIYHHLAGTYVDTGLPDQGLEWCEKALAIAPDNAHALWHKSLALLSKGHFASGFALYHNRKKLENWDNRDSVTAPQWGGRVSTLLLAGESSLYIHGEQGVGDEVMFASALPFLSAKTNGVKTVVVEVNKKVAPWIQYNFPNWKVVTKAPAKEDHVDASAKVALGDLFSMGYGRQAMYASNLKPYLKVPPNLISYYKDRLAEIGAPPYVGVAWVGGYAQTRVQDRSYALEYYKPLKKYGTCVSVQYKTPNTAQLLQAEMDKFGLIEIDQESAGGDLMHQAALSLACDYVVTNQQTAVHVCGASGAKCIALIPHNHHWRYVPMPRRTPSVATAKSMAFYGDHVTMFIKPETVQWDGFIEETLKKNLEFHDENKSCIF